MLENGWRAQLLSSVAKLGCRLGQGPRHPKAHARTAQLKQPVQEDSRIEPAISRGAAPATAKESLVTDGEHGGAVGIGMIRLVCSSQAVRLTPLGRRGVVPRLDQRAWRRPNSLTLQELQGGLRLLVCLRQDRDRGLLQDVVSSQLRRFVGDIDVADTTLGSRQRFRRDTKVGDR